MKLSFHPNKRTRVRVHGFRARMATKGGRRTLARRRLVGRVKLTVSNEKRKYVANRISVTRARRVRGLGKANVNRQASPTKVAA